MDLNSACLLSYLTSSLLEEFDGTEDEFFGLKKMGILEKIEGVQLIENYICLQMDINTITENNEGTVLS